MARCTVHSSTHQEDFLSLLSFKAILECGYNAPILYFQLVPSYRTDWCINKLGPLLQLVIQDPTPAPPLHVAIGAKWNGAVAVVVSDMQVWAICSCSLLCPLSYLVSIQHVSFPYCNGLLLAYPTCDLIHVTELSLEWAALGPWSLSAPGNASALPGPITHQELFLQKPMILYFKWHDLAPESQRPALLFSQWVCHKTLSLPTTDTLNTIKICWIVLPKWWAICIVVWTAPRKAAAFHVTRYMEQYL